MRSTFGFCLATSGAPTGWLYEIKDDGYCLRAKRDGNRVRLIARGGTNWIERFPWIVEAALKSRTKQFVIDGEAAVLGVDFISRRSSYGSSSVSQYR